MKNNLIICLGIILLFSSCLNDDEPNSQLSIQFTHNWDGQEVTNSDFSQIKFTNANGEQLSIERLRYLISNVIVIDQNNLARGVSGFNLIDVTNNNNPLITLPQNINNGTYTLAFTFGFDNIDNIDGAYPVLNTASWNVPSMLGGGYHFMQLDGKYEDSNGSPANYNYHVIRAVNASDPQNLIFEDTFFQVQIGPITIGNDAVVEVKMNIAEWFKNPNTWDLNVLNTVLMPNFDAQIMMNENGQNVFSLGTITQ